MFDDNVRAQTTLQHGEGGVVEAAMAERFPNVSRAERNVGEAALPVRPAEAADLFAALVGARA